MRYFQKFFSDTVFEGDEVKVLCPFHSDTHPSASVNTLKNTFHCFVCDVGYNEEQFLAKVKGLTIKNATKLIQKLEESEVDWDYTYKADLWADEDFLKSVLNLGLSKETIETCRLGMALVDEKKFLAVPVFYNDFLVDVRRYNLLKHPNLPKMFADKGAQAGYVVPYDLWKKDTSTTYVFEGEKDMLCARDLGLNAITLTGGAGATPNDYVMDDFEGREVIICYDNDEAGRQGAQRLFDHIHEKTASCKYINIADVVKEPKEDFFDYIHKYQGDIFEFTTLETHDFAVKEVKIKLTPIKAALANCVLHRPLTSVVTIVSEFADPFGVPTMVTAEKVEDSGNKRGNTLLLHDSKSWYLEEKNISDMLPLIEMDAKSNMVHGLLKRYMGIPANEEGLDMKLQSYKTVYKVVAIDKDVDSSSASLDVYSFQKLDVGGQYRITYRLYAHPTKNQKIVGIIDTLVNLGDKSDFRTDPSKLKVFQTQGTIQERLDYLYQSAKHHIAKHLDFDLWLTMDLVFNSILEIDYAGLMRGALDIFVLGDTQVGKSETSSALTHLYNFGHFLSLKTSTTEGLIGGSNMVGGSYINTVGAIPRQHTKLVVMEEFSGARKDFIKKMTEIRSSGTLRLVRVAGEMIIPCRLRMITISNPINDDNGNPRFLGSFPNGVIPIMELITSAEDVARYDGFFLVPKRENRLNPFAYELVGEPIAKEYYEHKANWVMTRQANQVIYEPGVEKYIWEKGEELNTHFECNFPMFGTTTPKKLARFVVALASLLVNVDETYEKIIVTKEMVDFMVEHLMRTYTAPHFRLNDYKEEYDSYHSFTDADVKELQKLYVANSVLFDYLAKQSATSRNDIAAVSGLDRDLFGPIFNKLVSHKFLRMTRDTIFPTEKFRKVYRALDKTKRLDTASPQIGGEANGA